MPNKSPHRATGLVAENLQLPAQFKRPDGSMETIMLDAQVIRPDDDVPHPLLVFNHGYASTATESYVDFIRFSAVQYASYGLVTLAFTRRGVGLSEGKITPGVEACTPREILRFESENSEDILEAIRLIAQKPYVDKSKIISIGGETGGFQAITLVSHKPRGLYAAINFDGTIPKKSGSRTCPRDSLVDAVSMIGKIPSIPTLWLYAGNSRNVQKAGRDMANAFIQNGGEVEFFTIPPIIVGEKFPFEDGSSTWSKYINPFLRKIGIQTLDEPIPITRIRVIYGPDKNS